MNNTIIKSTTPNINTEELVKAITGEYTEVACNPEHKIHFTSGWPLARRLDYPSDVLRQLPREAIRPFAGVGNPFKIGKLYKGEVILDIGSGAGMDCLFASKMIKGASEIYGLDMTQAMLEKARENARVMGAKNVHFVKGKAEHMPIMKNVIDVVLSNGVINLCPDKFKVYREIYRVLKPGGRFMIADVLLDNPVPVESRELIHLWTNCVAGAIPTEEYLDIIKDAGFENVEITDSYDVFKDARIAKSAALFGARGYNVIGYKPQV